jgi:hypothetical protein
MSEGTLDKGLTEYQNMVQVDLRNILQAFGLQLEQLQSKLRVEIPGNFSPLFPEAMISRRTARSASAIGSEPETSYKE